MMKLTVYSPDGASSTEKDFDIPSFEEGRGREALRQVLVAMQANRRQGTHATKTRAFVRGGGKKPFRQKGTGRGRQGSSRAPQYKGGGTVFGPQPRDYTQKINRKVKQLAFNRALYDRAHDGELLVIEQWSVDAPKTKVINGVLEKIAPSGKLLLVDDSFSDAAVLSARNLERVQVAEARELNPMNLTSCSRIIVSQKGLDKILSRVNGKVEA